MAPTRPDPELDKRETGRPVVSRLQSDSGEVASWLIFMAALVAAAVAAAAILTLVIGQLADDVAAAVDGELAPRDGTIPDNGDGERDATDDPGDGSGDADGEALPVSTTHCSVTINASAGALGLDVGLETSAEIIIQVMPDGTQFVTIGGELAANTGPGSSAGAGVTINDATVGAYAAASAKAYGALGGGVQFELAPGESVTELLVGIAVSTNPVSGPAAGGINFIFPDTIPTAPLPDTVFVDGSVWGKAGGTAQAGIGWVSAGAAANGEARTDQTYAIHADGTYSATTTLSGVLTGDANVTGGIPFFAWGTAGVAADANGSVSVETIYDSSFNPVEMIVTTSYGYDADVVYGDDQDPATITTQQWTLDMTDPEVRAAVENLDAFVPNPVLPVPDIPTRDPFDSWDVVTDHAVTSGALTQELSTSALDIKVQAGAIAAGVSGGANGTCTELN